MRSPAVHTLVQLYILVGNGYVLHEARVFVGADEVGMKRVVAVNACNALLLSSAHAKSMCTPSVFYARQKIL